MSGITLFHGSSKIIERPVFGKGNNRNDYGLGFYCTENIELAKEWACMDKNGGFVNSYSLNVSSLKILDLSLDEYNILNWLALLVRFRTFKTSNQIAARAKEYLLANFLPDISGFDAILGYRANDSYFAFALDFMSP